MLEKAAFFKDCQRNCANFLILEGYPQAGDAIFMAAWLDILHGGLRVSWIYKLRLRPNDFVSAASGYLWRLRGLKNNDDATVLFTGGLQ